jgi:hypothetical protein
LGLSVPKALRNPLKIAAEKPPSKTFARSITSPQLSPRFSLPHGSACGSPRLCGQPLSGTQEFAWPDPSALRPHPFLALGRSALQTSRAKPCRSFRLGTFQRCSPTSLPFIISHFSLLDRTTATKAGGGAGRGGREEKVRPLAHLLDGRASVGCGSQRPA